MGFSAFLLSAIVTVSKFLQEAVEELTKKHELLSVSMLEAIGAGVVPVCLNTRCGIRDTRLSCTMPSRNFSM
jgi:hypothetical protein